MCKRSWGRNTCRMLYNQMKQNINDQTMNGTKIIKHIIENNTDREVAWKQENNSSVVAKSSILYRLNPRSTTF